MKKIIFLLLLIPVFALAEQVQWSVLSEKKREQIKEIAAKHKMEHIYLSLSQALENYDQRIGKSLILPLETFYDTGFKVSKIVDGYVIYEFNSTYKHIRFAMPKDKKKSYPENSKLDVTAVFKIDGTVTFKTLTGEIELYKVIPLESGMFKWNEKGQFILE